MSELARIAKELEKDLSADELTALLVRLGYVLNRTVAVHTNISGSYQGVPLTGSDRLAAGAIDHMGRFLQFLGEHGELKQRGASKAGNWPKYLREELLVLVGIADEFFAALGVPVADAT